MLRNEIMIDIIVVSISCLTYNHSRFIKECFDGFIMQKCNFKFEVLVHDDASTDGTIDIIKEYQLKYPDIIKPIIQTTNQYSQGKRGFNGKYNYSRAKGKYIALCEGDDYWTDPYKLQKQVDFLEENPEYSLCVGGFMRYDESLKKCDDSIFFLNANKANEKGFSFTLDDTKKHWLTKTLTALFRADSNLEKLLERYKYGRDINLFYHILKNGKGFYFNEIMGVYRVHEGGINSMKYGQVNSNAAYNVYKELYEINKDEWTRYMNIRNTLALFNYNLYNKYEGNTGAKRLKLYFEAIKLTSSISDLRLLFTNLLSPTFKSKLGA